VNSPTNNWG